MKNILKNIYIKQQFEPDWAFGIWINPYFIIRRGLLKGIYKIAETFTGGKLLDFGCGSKPYEHFFNVDCYLGIDIEKSGHDHITSKIDKYYDGK